MEKPSRHIGFGSHPAPVGNDGVSGRDTSPVVHPDAGLTLGNYEGCVGVGLGLIAAFYSDGMTVATNTAAGSMVLSGHDDVQACATAFSNFIYAEGAIANMNALIQASSGDMASILQGIQNAGPTDGVGSPLHYEQSVGPDGSGAAGGGANGPGGGSNGGGYVSADGSDQYGYGGAGSLLKATFAELNQSAGPSNSVAAVPGIVHVYSER